jgi:hypothetical protein
MVEPENGCGTPRSGIICASRPARAAEFGPVSRGTCMGYSTSLYAVDLDALRAAIGSRDARLLKRLRPPKKKPRKKDPMNGPRVKLTRNSQIILNRQPVSFAELKAELNRPKWRGTYLFTYIESSRIRGRWSKTGSFFLALTKSYPASQFLGAVVCTSDADLASGGGDEEEISEKEAAAELVEGKLTQPKDAAHQYGYGLEVLCERLGTHLATIEGKRGMLKALELNTPLSRERSPVKLPRRDDFPGIGYLTGAEVKRELERLRQMDMSFPEDDLIEDDRRAFLWCLRRAAKKGVGIVAFYY